MFAFVESVGYTGPEDEFNLISVVIGAIICYVIFKLLTYEKPYRPKKKKDKERIECEQFEKMKEATKELESLYEGQYKIFHSINAKPEEEDDEFAFLNERAKSVEGDQHNDDGWSKADLL